jgi:HPt (histidine-containing phosphotransfer) domain-containing protein
MTTPEEERLKMEHEAALETLLAVQQECMKLERENKELRDGLQEISKSVRELRKELVRKSQLSTWPPYGL